MKRYPKYKESGVEFIGEIPAHWEARKLGQVSTIFKGGTPKRNVDKYFQGDLPWARPVDVTALKGTLYIDDTKIHISEEALGNSGARRLPPGTVLLTSRATIGEIAITTVPMATNQGFANFVCNEGLLNIYLAYYLQAIKDLLISLGSGTTFLEVTKGTLVGVKIPLPLLSEQTQIAAFLNHKTGQIDELIRIKEQQIELLKEQRTTLINQAVTKGLDPNVGLKPSGVEWIGGIPTHWKVKRLKYIADLNMGQSPPSEEYNSDQLGTPFLQGNAEFGPHHPTPKIYCPTANKHAIPGNILLSVRAPVGAINIADQEYGIGRGLCAIRPRTNQLERRYAKYLLEVVRTELYVVATGSTYDAVTVDEVFNMTCVVPPISEQTQVADFLDRKTKQIDELIAAEQRKIELLKEYRQSLISEAVTGKIDVRSEV